MLKKYLNIISIGIIASQLFLFFGCMTVEETIYLGDVEVTAPICPPPTHVNINKDVGDITITPRISVNTNSSVITGRTVDRYNSSFRLSNDSTYRAKKNNLSWYLSDYTLGLDVDFKVTKGFSVFGGFNYSSGEQTSLLGGNVGIGFHSHTIKPIVRLDIGITIQTYDYSAITIVHTKTTSMFGVDEDWGIYGDRGNSTNINPFGTLTINSSYDSSFFNWFVIGGFYTQNLLGFEPGSTSYPIFPFLGSYTKVDKRSDMLTGFIYLNPGISISLHRQIRILLSAKMNYEVLATHSKQMYFLPSVQFDFQL
ncbi:MAG: hypothetical protein B6D44_08660 [Ignavibacteriales bacterium UTCHB2]|jgi:hypothetical protein|nr:MAG: hypothetical protein BWY38_01408 [Ignavibacteria bacterium ADurb.Bin266]OQY72975.1 MAG: hypothetical protein B6D44_08660 [Ignavibacteriales bacterium UTCHB2]HQI40371.1 hypothetical protein [Ignavibacteriaceae bacterium]HQJ46634.1 hypothetical protein [Ignavibacteriaceae bacterium]